MNGSRVGDYDQVTMLTSPVGFLRDFQQRKGFRRRLELEGRSAPEVVNYVYGLLFQESDGSVADAYKDWMRYCDVLLLPNGGEAFDGELAILLEEETDYRLIWRPFSDRMIRETHLPAGEFDRVISSFLNWAGSVASQST